MLIHSPVRSPTSTHLPTRLLNHLLCIFNSLSSFDTGFFTPVLPHRDQKPEFAKMQLTTLLVSVVLGAVSVSAAATTTFPTAAGATTLSAPQTISGTFDGGMKRFGRGGKSQDDPNESEPGHPY